MAIASERVQSIWPQPLIAIGTSAAALVALLAATPLAPAFAGSLRAALATLVLVAAVSVAYRFPIYVRHATKVYAFTVPLYLLAVLLTPPAAAVAAGIAVFIGEMLVKDERDTYVCDVATNAARWSVIALVGAAIVRTTAGPEPIHALALVVGAIAMWAADILSLPLLIAPISGERPRTIIAASYRDGGAVEAVQYGLGVAGALLAGWHTALILLLTVPIIAISFLGGKDADTETLALLEGMADNADLRASALPDHSRRVSLTAARILAEMGVTGQEESIVVTAARLHDIGKIEAVDASPAEGEQATADEPCHATSHPVLGAALLRRYPDMGAVAQVVLYHHERWDGAGYPDGLQGIDIPFGARLVAVADAYVHLTTTPPGARPRSAAEIARALGSESGVSLDGAIVEVLLRTVCNGREGNEVAGMPALPAT